MKVIYHNDLDGKCSAAIVNLYYDASAKADFWEMDYKDDLTEEQWNDIGRNEKVYILDYSFYPKDMAKLLDKSREVVWIDHHKTSLAYPYNTPDIEGIRRNGTAGCELTWEYLMQDKLGLGTFPPNAVKYIGDYDTWSFRYGWITKAFYEGMKSVNSSPTSDIWPILFAGEVTPTEEKIIQNGLICIDYRNQICSGYAERYGFECKIKGFDHKCFAMNIYEWGSEAFGKRLEKYDVCCSFVFSGKVWTVGFYSDKPNIDVAEIAEKFDGGGHKGAAGCNPKNLEDVLIVEKQNG